ncbi:phosphoribosylformylglycinamidine cyclo-ligase, partial [bacterium]|nr:phosphoribosylformylglycinamidine cyclo-ligase [bacterium]
IRYVKDNLFNTPPIFNLIRESNNLSNHEMYRVYNMGSRMEIVCDSKVADKIIDISNKFKVDAQVIGRTEKSDKTEVLIKTKDEEIKYE